MYNAQQLAVKALLGEVVSISNNTQLEEVLLYVKLMQGYDYDPQDVVKKAFQYCPDGTARYITINRVMDDVHISIVIETEEVAVPENLATYKGVFAYVFNVDYEIGSELGYIFFEKDGQGNYHRVG